MLNVSDTQYLIPTDPQQFFGHDLRDSFVLVMGVYFIILSTLSLLCNAILIKTVALKRDLRNTTNLFMVSLAISDIFIALFVIPQDAIFLLNGHHVGGEASCGVKEVFFFLSLPASVMNLLLLTIEKCIKILSPRWYSKIFNRVNNFIILTVIWTYIGLVALFPIYFAHVLGNIAVFVEFGVCWLQFPLFYIYFQLFANFFVPSFIILLLNFIIFGVAKRHYKIIFKQRVDTVAASRPHGSNSSYCSINWLSIVRNMKAARTITLLVSVFIVTWLTFLVTVTINVQCGECLKREIVWISNGINYSSCLLNPIIYGLLNRQIRNVLILKKI